MSRGPAIANGTRIGPYEVVGWIGAGGMGEECRTRDPASGETSPQSCVARFCADPR